MPQKDFCCVPHCSVDHQKSGAAVDGERLLQWVSAVRRDVKQGEFATRRDTCVCSKHFKGQDYIGGEKSKVLVCNELR